MPKLKLLLVGFFIILLKTTVAQNYPVHYFFADADSVAKEQLKLENQFPSRIEASTYLAGLPKLLQDKGFVTASIDSLLLDSASASVQLFLGQQYKWARIATYVGDEDILSAIHWPKSSFKNAGVDWASLTAWQNQILNHLENNGHPFARVFFDSISIDKNELAAFLKIDRGPLYTLDSIRLEGNAKISREFLQRYLELPNGTVYNKRKLQEVSKKIKEITYVEEMKPSDVSLSATGSVLNLYLKAKRNSLVNVLVGFLPSSNSTQGKKFLITGEANVLLKNSLGAGETIGLNWQQLQVKSPRLNILYEHPFLFRSPLGLNFNFDMLRKDSTFVNINMQTGTSYMLSANQIATVFVQRRQTILNGVDTNNVKQTKKLPVEADVSSTNLGISYSFNNTNYRFNPQRGNEFVITTSAGTKKIKKNNQVLELKDAFFKYEALYDTVKLSTYQFRIHTTAAHYFPLGKQTVLKTAVNAGVFQSGNYFLNELFQIGGYKLLRGFTEESEYVSQYAIGTLEYRYLIGQNSNFFAFVDGGWAKNPILGLTNRGYIGTGLGMSLETKAGIFNLAWAIGKRNDAQLNLRQSKIHFGFVNYF